MSERKLRGENAGQMWGRNQQQLSPDIRQNVPTAFLQRMFSVSLEPSWESTGCFCVKVLKRSREIRCAQYLRNSPPHPAVRCGNWRQSTDDLCSGCPSQAGPGVSWSCQMCSGGAPGLPAADYHWLCCECLIIYLQPGLAESHYDLP